MINQTKMDKMYLYIIDFWIPFPTSEYGGVVLVTASSKEDVMNILMTTPYLECMQYRDYHAENHNEWMKEKIENAKCFEIQGTCKSEVVYQFIT